MDMNLDTGCRLPVVFERPVLCCSHADKDFQTKAVGGPPKATFFRFELVKNYRFDGQTMTWRRNLEELAKVANPIETSLIAPFSRLDFLLARVPIEIICK